MPLLIQTQRSAQRLLTATPKTQVLTTPKADVVPLFPFSQRVSHRYTQRFQPQGLAYR